VKSTAIDTTIADSDGVFRWEGRARVFASEQDAIRAIKGGTVRSGEIMVLAGIGPMGTGMEETYQVTSALKYLKGGSRIALLTDGRFSGVSTGACIGHIGPEALAGGPIGKVVDGDLVRVVLDPHRNTGSVDLVGDGKKLFSPEEGAHVLAGRKTRPEIRPHPDLPDDTRLWAALQSASGGTWGGCVWDHERICEALTEA
jgi:dihydroxyacid dehydratase/phosphogluconate dehydratase